MFRTAILAALALVYHAAHAQTFYTVEWESGDLYTVSIEGEDLEFDLVGSTSIPGLGSLDYGRDGYLYSVGIDSPRLNGTAPSALYKVDPRTGVSTRIRELNIDFDLEGGLAIVDDNTAYAVGGFETAPNNTRSSSWLYRVDLVTGTVQELGFLGIVDISGLTISADGSLIGFASPGGGEPGLANRAFEIDTDTLELTVIDGVTFTASGGTGGATTASDGTVWTLGTNLGFAGRHNMAQWDVESGQLLSSFSKRRMGLGRFSGLAVPTPGSVTLLAVAGVIATRRRRTT